MAGPSSLLSMSHFCEMMPGLKQIFCQLDGWSVVFAGNEPILRTDAKQNAKLKQISAN
jgi:hypothetical protein